MLITNTDENRDFYSKFSSFKIIPYSNKYSETTKISIDKEEYRSETKNAHLLRKYLQCQSSAQVRDKEFTISFEEYSELIVKSCVFCGDPSTGLDRIDSKLGYISGNCQPCCGTCNMMKQSKTDEQFINQVIKIYNNQKNRS